MTDRIRRTKIVVTLGPASSSPEGIRNLLSMGADVFRLNFSHGSQEEHRERIRIIRSLCRTMNRDAAILQDLCGPKIRAGIMEGGGVRLEDDAAVAITTQPVTGTRERFSCSYAGLPRDVREGDRILLDDGLLQLRVESRGADEVTCRVVHGGVLGDRKGINLPDTAVSAPAVTVKDMQDLLCGIEEGVDFVALSFVRRAADLDPVREALAERGSDAQILAKIEKPEAIREIDAIIRASDGILVARGDLGVEMDLARVPVLQKDMVRRANEQDKYVIVATQMLDSMIRNPVPTRAEVSDATNAIMDGADALMLSGETAVGRYPLESVGMLNRIALETEAYAGRYRPPWNWERINPVHAVNDAVAMAAYNLCRDLKAAAVVAYSSTGGTALFLSRNRPAAPILAFTADRRALRRMHLFWGVFPVLDPSLRTKADLVSRADPVLRERGWVQSGDRVVIVAGTRFGEVGSTNGVEVATVL